MGAGDRTEEARYGATLLQYGLDHHRDRLSADFAAISEIYIDHEDALQALWRDGPATVVHGDPHLGNLFDDHGRTGFLDWGLIKVSTPMRDVSYFLTLGLDIDDRREHERDLIRHYLDVRDAARRHRDHVRRGVARASDPGRVPRARVLSGRDVPRPT